MQRSDEREGAADPAADDAVLGEDAISAREPTADTGGTTGSTGVDVGGDSGLGSLFSLRAFLAALALTLVGVAAGGAVPLVGTVGSLVGVALAGFALGAVSSVRRYLETALAGGSVLGASFAIGLLTTGVLPVGLRFFGEYGLAFGGLGVGLGATLAAVGHYFGRDLRAGLTRAL